MSLQDEVAVLRRIPLFANMESSKLKLIAFTGERLEYEAGEVLFEQGEEGDAAYVVLEGEADIIVATANGAAVPVAKAGRNSIFGEIAILCDVPRTATVKAASKLTVLKLKKAEVLDLLKQFPDMSIELMRVLALRLATTTAELSQARAALKSRA